MNIPYLSNVDWKPVEHAAAAGDGLPYATHQGVFDLFGQELRCYRLSDGRAVIHADDMHQVLQGMLAIANPDEQKLST